MRAYYPDGFLGPPVLNLDRKAVTHLFAEMDQIAAKLRACSQFVQGDLQIAFCKLQRERIGNLSKDENLSSDDWLWLFDVWCDHDRAQQVIDDAERAARFDALCEERETLFTARRMFPGERDAVNARLLEIGRELADSMPSCPTAPLGEWINSEVSRGL